MAKGKRLRKELWRRWAIWIAWVVGWVVVFFIWNPPLPVLVIVAFLWAISILFVGNYWGPFGILGRVYNIEMLRKDRIRRQFIEAWEMMNPRWVPSYRRRRHWIKKMKFFAESSYISETGERMYVMPLLSLDLPLDFFEEIADYDDWKSYVDIYIDWDEFNEYYPDTDNFADYDSKGRSKIDRMEDDMLYGRILNEGGRSGRDYRVVPSDVRKWFPPYTADDGLVTVHEDTIGSEGYDVDAFDTSRGDDEKYDFPDEDPEEDEEEEEYDY